MSDKPLRPRQAVVIMHGIGEQRPMDTLQSFVTSVTSWRFRDAAVFDPRA